jgi:tRNA pseudouridine38-40 synthase
VVVVVRALAVRSILRSHTRHYSTSGPSTEMVRCRLALEVAYLGTRYIGWQAQPAIEGTAVYDVLHAALSASGITESGPMAAGRTDKGTHAMSQWCTVNVPQSTPAVTGPLRDAELNALRDAINKHLPSDVRCLSVCDALPHANAVSSATGKTYSYFVLHGSAGGRCEPGWRDACWVLTEQLDVRAMRNAVDGFVGRRDFRHLTCHKAPSKSTIRHVTSASIHKRRHLAFPLLGCYDGASGQEAPCPCARSRCSRCGRSTSASHDDDRSRSHGADAHDSEGSDGEGSQGAVGVELLQFRFSGEGFLKHQVRRMVGLLVRIGRGLDEPAATADATDPEGNSRFDPRRTVRHEIEAPAAGLWLQAVDCEHMLMAPSSVRTTTMPQPDGIERAVLAADSTLSEDSLCGAEPRSLDPL